MSIVTNFAKNISSCPSKERDVIIFYTQTLRQGNITFSTGKINLFYDTVKTRETILFVTFENKDLFCKNKRLKPYVRRNILRHILNYGFKYSVVCFIKHKFLRDVLSTYNKAIITCIEYNKNIKADNNKVVIAFYDKKKIKFPVIHRRQVAYELFFKKFNKTLFHIVEHDAKYFKNYTYIEDALIEISNKNWNSLITGAVLQEQCKINGLILSIENLFHIFSLIKEDNRDELINTLLNTEYNFDIENLTPGFILLILFSTNKERFIEEKESYRRLFDALLSKLVDRYPLLCALHYNQIPKDGSFNKYIEEYVLQQQKHKHVTKTSVHA